MYPGGLGRWKDVEVSDSLRITIEGLDADGRGVAEVGRRSALVSQAYPGEEVVFAIDRKTRGTFQGRVKRMITPSEDRVDHPCPHEFTCTGCPLLALSPEAEEGFKIDKLQDVFGEVANEDDSVEFDYVVPTEPFGYRHYAKQVFGVERGRVVLGSFVAGTHDLVDNEGCPVLVQPLQDLLSELVEEVRSLGLRAHVGEEQGLRFAVARASRFSGEVLLVLSTSDPRHGEPSRPLRKLMDQMVHKIPILAGVVLLLNQDSGHSLLAGEVLAEVGASAITEALLGHEYSIGPRSFFQVNPVSAETLFEVALAFAGEGSRCLELFAGVGALTFGLAENFEEVRAVELVPEAVSALNRRAQELGLNVEGIVGDATDVAPLLAEFDASVCVADPPRRGLGEALCAQLVESRVERLVLLSCEPNSLRRDLPILLEGGFKLREVCGVDQFPRTSHIETVTLLERVVD